MAYLRGNLSRLEAALGVLILSGAISGIANEYCLKSKKLEDCAKAVCVMGIVPYVLTQEYRRSKSKISS